MKPTCDLDGCTTTAYCRGLCQKHYRVKRDRGELPPTAHTFRDAARREYVIGEVEWLKSFGVSPELIADGLGYSGAESLLTLMRRWGRHDLAVYFMKPAEENWARQYMSGRLRGAA